MSTIAAQLPANAAAGTNANPAVIAMTAPSEPPVLTPRTYGDASGFLISAWNRRPARDRAPPMIADATARGSLYPNTLRTSRSSGSKLSTRPTSILVVPLSSPATIASTRSTAATPESERTRRTVAVGGSPRGIDDPRELLRDHREPGARAHEHS